MRKHFSALPRAQMSVKILSNLGESALEYQVEYEYNKGDNDILTVTAPESLSGVRLTISGDTPGGFTLQYADAVLDFQMDGPAGMTPADAIAALFSDLAEGEPTETAAETLDGVRAVSLKYETMDKSPALAKTVWLRASDCAPVCAELYQDGEKKLSLFFQEYTEQKEV